MWREQCSASLHFFTAVEFPHQFPVEKLVSKRLEWHLSQIFADSTTQSRCSGYAETNLPQLLCKNVFFLLEIPRQWWEVTRFFHRRVRCLTSKWTCSDLRHWFYCDVRWKKAEGKNWWLNDQDCTTLKQQWTSGQSLCFEKIRSQFFCWQKLW